jgi:two-component system chemotaxis response regulator CheY
MVTVFIVEDEIILLEIYRNILELKGHEVIGQAHDGLECLRKLIGDNKGTKPELANMPDFILMDHRMPIKNGLDTMKELLAKKPELKIIFVSADVSVKFEALKSGAIDFIIKPFNMQTLFDTLDKFID